MSANETAWHVSRHASPDHSPQFGLYAEGESHDFGIIRGDGAEQRANLAAASPLMLAALKRAEDALDEAVSVHIYDESNGDEPDEDCEYMATLADIRAAIAAAEGNA